MDSVKLLLAVVSWLAFCVSAEMDMKKAFRAGEKMMQPVTADALIPSDADGRQLAPGTLVYTNDKGLSDGEHPGAFEFVGHEMGNNGNCPPVIDAIKAAGPYSCCRSTPSCPAGLQPEALEEWNVARIMEDGSISPDKNPSPKYVAPANSPKFLAREQVDAGGQMVTRMTGCGFGGLGGYRCFLPGRCCTSPPPAPTAAAPPMTAEELAEKEARNAAAMVKHGDAVADGSLVMTP